MGMCRRYLLPSFEQTVNEFSDPSSLSVIEFGFQDIDRDSGYDETVIYPVTHFRDLFKGRFKSLRTIDICGGDGVEAIDLSIIMEESNSADIITDYGTLEHIGTDLGSQYNAWINAHRLLKTGGVVIHAVPLRGKWDGHCKWYYTVEFFEKFKNCGYEILRLGTTWQGLVYCKMRKIEDKPFMTLKEFSQGLGYPRKVLIDCGAWAGDSVNIFRAAIPNISEYEIVMFEPNPELFKLFNGNPKYNNCRKIEAAVSNKSGIQKLWGCVSNGWSLGSTLEKSKADWDGIGETDYLEVPTVNLSEFIMENFFVDDYILLKLDIEGSEYDVLENLLESGAIAYIKKLYCEFHDRWMSPEFMKKKTNLIEKLVAIGITPEFWG